MEETIIVGVMRKWKCVGGDGVGTRIGDNQKFIECGNEKVGKG